MEINCKIKKRLILISALVSIVVGIMTQSITIVLNVGTTDKNRDRGTLQLFYQDYQNSAMNEENSVTKQNKAGDIKFSINKQILIGKQIRLDIDDVNILELKSIKVKWRGVTFFERSGKELYSTIEEKTQVLTAYSKEDNATFLQRDGNDANIIFNLPMERCIFVCIILFLIKLAILFFVLFIFSIILYQKFLQNPDLCIIRIKIFLIIGLLFSAIYVDIITIKAILNMQEVSYVVDERNMEYIPVNSQKTKSEFISVGKSSNSIDLDIELSGTPKGKIKYSIYDSREKCLWNNSSDINIESYLSSDTNQLILNVSEAGLIQGQRYVIKMEFADCENIAIKMDDSTPIISQTFQFQYTFLCIAIIGVCNLLLLGVLWYILKSGMSKRAYCLLSLIVGLMAVFIMPPASMDDEYRHFIRAYTLAQGTFELDKIEVNGNELGNADLGSNGDTKGYFICVPKEINELRLLGYSENYNNGTYAAEVNRNLCIDKLISLIKNSPQGYTERISANGVATRGMVYYWPQVIFVWFGILMGVRPLALFYLARIGQLAVCTFLGWIALKLSPRNKMAIWLLTFIPNALLLRISCNTDGLLIAEVMLLIFFVLHIREKEISILTKKGILFCVFVFFLSVNIVKMKPPYVILILILPFILKKENYKEIIYFWEKYKKRVVVLLFALIAVTACLGVLFRHNLLDVTYGFVPKEHIKYMLQHPKDIFVMFWNKWIQQIKELYQAVNTGIIPYCVVAAVSLAACKKELRIWQRFSSAICFLAIMWAVELFGYVIFPPDNGAILGISFRYILPALPLLAIALPCGNERSHKFVTIITPLFIWAALLTSCIRWIGELWIM